MAGHLPMRSSIWSVHSASVPGDELQFSCLKSERPAYSEYANFLFPAHEQDPVN